MFDLISRGPYGNRVVPPAAAPGSRAALPVGDLRARAATCPAGARSAGAGCPGQPRTYRRDAAVGASASKSPSESASGRPGRPREQCPLARRAQTRGLSPGPGSCPGRRRRTGSAASMTRRTSRSGSTCSQPGPQAPVSPAGAGKAASEVHWEPDGHGDLMGTCHKRPNLT